MAQPFENFNRSTPSRVWYRVLFGPIPIVLICMVLVVVAVNAGKLPAVHKDVFLPRLVNVMPVEPVVKSITPRLPTATINPNAAPTTAPTKIFDEPKELPVFQQPKGPEGIDFLPKGNGPIVLTPPPPAPPAPPERVPVGGIVREPRKIHHVPPVYPRTAISARIEGVVIIKAVIGIDGRIKEAQVLRSLPFLDRAALDAVNQWVFTPTTLNGRPVEVEIVATVNFNLR